MRFPTAVDTIVVGAGTAGSVVAGRLAAGSSERTLLLEAGPDYGPASSGRWPHDLLDAASVRCGPTTGAIRASSAAR